MQPFLYVVEDQFGTETEEEDGDTGSDLNAEQDVEDFGDRSRSPSSVRSEGEKNTRRASKKNKDCRNWGFRKIQMK